MGLKERSRRKSFYLIRRSERRNVLGEGHKEHNKGQQLLYFDFAAGFSPSLKRPALLCPPWLLVFGIGRENF